MFPDPMVLKSKAPHEIILSAGSRLGGIQQTQEDYFINFQDECFVLTDGFTGLPHADVAAKLVNDTAIWGYKLVRQRPFYWADKQQLLRRIFRSSNLTVWQKRRERGFEDGLATTLSVVIVSQNKMWAGSVGDSPIYLYRDGLIDEVTPADRDQQGALTNMLGMRRLGLVPHLAVERLLPGDIVVMMTAGVSDYVGEDELRATLEMAGDTKQSLETAVTHLISTAAEHGSEGKLTACILKKISGVTG